MRRRVVGVALCALVVATTGACRARATVDIDVARDGSGTVTVDVSLDATAAERLGDPATAFALDDLRDGGWTVEGPDVDDGGAVEVSASKGFSAPDELGPLLEEVGGADGALRDVDLVVDDALGRTLYDLSARVELTGDPGQFSDPALAEALGGTPLGRSPELLALEGAADPDAMRLAVRVRLPGGAPDTDGEVVDGAATWDFPVTGGEATSAELTASSRSTDTTTWWLFGIAAVAAVLAVAAVVVGLVRARGAGSGGGSVTRGS